MNMLIAHKPRMCVEVVFDFVCPWSYMGIRQIVRAFGARQDIETIYRWQPFQLNPSLDERGVDFEDYLRIRHGGKERAARLLRMIETQGGGFECAFRFSRIEKVPSTLNPHRLIEWAATRGCCTQLVLGIFEAFFLHGQDIGDPVVLADIARTHGFDHDLALPFLMSRTLVGTVMANQIKAQKAGVNGVPSLIVEGLALTGAHETIVLNRLMDAAISVSGVEPGLMAATPLMSQPLQAM